MRQYQLSGPDGLDALSLVDVAEPTPGPTEVLVEMKAWSLNYRDLSMPHGGYPGNDKVKRDPPLVPLSDGAGEVVAVGERVRRFEPGDRVAGCFFQGWDDGELTPEKQATALGGAIDGCLAERVVFDERGLVHAPEHLSLEQTATLPCAGVTAWEALCEGNLRAGHTVLLLGTGGVSIYGLQLAKAAGARAIITSSSDEKLERARALGADVTINYREHPEWNEQVLEATGGRGVDTVLEVGGVGTFERSLKSTRVDGTVCLIGILSNPKEKPSPLLALFRRLRVQGIYVGSRARFEELNRAMTINRLEPVIDRVFGFEEARGAFEHLKSAKHLGKVVIARA